MALFKITVKMSKHCDGMVIEPGMSIQYAAFFSNVLSNDKERDKKKMNALNPAYLNVEKL